MNWSEKLNDRVARCRLCPRLVPYREQIAREKKREFRDWDYWGRPVPSFGDPNARLLIIGLAPGAHGANRTGRMFTGDQSGRWLYRALHKAGFAASDAWQQRGDGQQLRDCYITAVIHCAPPGNKPLPAEIAHCRRYFEEERQQLKRVRVVVALGQIAFDHYLRTIGMTPRPKFAHNVIYDLGGSAGAEPSASRSGGRGSSHAVSLPVLIASYHPSRQNTNTGKLTEPMLDAVFESARAFL